ncbi:MAG: triose-phosphate isomerase [Spirochaetota bacterium]|nr:MAG: triose-phosphate isomerase [Spirochaetota bacterium]
MRTPFIAGNWKMFLDKEKGVGLAEELVKGTEDILDREILICPSFPLLSDVARAIEGSKIQLGAQNLHYEEQGAFTGEISASMLLSIPCSWVIIGHSERRHIFKESNDLVNRKVRSALKQGLKVILCVGELIEERESGKTEDVVREQLVKGLQDVQADGMKDTIIAYEPVWAIGTGKTATPEDADNVQSFIRGILSNSYSEDTARNVRILYGGSVKPANIDGLMAKDNVDGVLVGGASLEADSFLRIISFGE